MTLSSLNRSEVLYMVVPNLIGGAIYYLTKKKYSRSSTSGRGKKVWFQPEPFIFFIVWAILFSFAGYYLYHSTQDQSGEGLFADNDYSRLSLRIYLLFGVGFLWMILFAMDQDRLSMLCFIPLITLSLSVEDMIYKKYNVIYRLWSGWAIFAAILQSHSK